MSDERRVACLYLETQSREQRAAVEWASEAGEVEAVPMAAVRDGRADLAAYDVCWWHRDAPLSVTDRVAACRPAIESYLEGGGGLLLTLHALSAVAAWGIDPVPPDAAGREELPEPTGYLRKAIYADHPVFDGFERLRVPTREPTPSSPFARYERLLPERADVLGCTVRGPDDVPHEATLFSWRVGDGAVLGAGTALAFAGDADHAGNGRRLVGNALRYLAGDADGGGSPVPTGRPKAAAGLRAMRAALADDPHRPRYHLAPPANWLNDPNGLFEWNGRYHVFYQYNPGGPYHHAIHWGHAVSDDLVRWRDEPVALTPSPNGPDRDGCWSGCAIDDDGVPALLYTGGRDRKQLPCLATAADDDLRSWHKHDANPIIDAAPADLDVLETDHWAAEFRDHCVWREDGTWYHVIGSGVRDVGGAALLYRGEDLESWAYVGPLLVGDWDGAGEVWECPELLDLGARDLLHVSNYEEVRYFLGETDLGTGTFEPEERGLLDYGDYYAPQSMTLSDGRTLTWGWLPEARSAAAQWDAGWSGTLSLPRELSLGEDGTLRQRPAAELEALRGDPLVDATLAPSAGEPVSVADGRALELALEVGLGGAEAVDLRLFETPDGAERTVLRYDGESVTVDRRRSSRDPEATETAQSMPVDADGPLSLRVFVDGSVIEAFANERRCLTSRVYPTLADATGVSLAADGGDARVACTVWRLEGAWDPE
ncbi:glycoside hydrolase family 32 protein [Salinilacihabitans rarus]|uniref:glycoside hydrolase family 32 protein n=1 Tax=Salinilacihabitans rarus TaxID=2961596 RepID=UPI0020C8A630|nr:glycoside hydrolase family 32 protein [Salinilacihabitans rarus]